MVEINVRKSLDEAKLLRRAEDYVLITPCSLSLFTFYVH